MARTERRSVERKIVTSILWVGILPTAFTLIINYAVTREAQRSAAFHALETEARITSVGLQLAILTYPRTVSSLSKNAIIVESIENGRWKDSLIKDRILSVLRQESESADDPPSIFSLFDVEGNILFSTGEIPDNDLTHPDWIQKVTKPDFYDFRHYRDSDRYLARLIAPIHSPQTGKTIGFLAEDQGVSSLMNLALFRKATVDEKEKKGDTYQIGIIESKGRGRTNYIDQSIKNAPIRIEFMDPTLRRHLMSPNHEMNDTLHIRNYQTRGEKEDAFVAYCMFSSLNNGYNAYVIVYRPAQDVFASINWWAFFTLACGIIIITLFSIIAYRDVHNNIVRPVSLLNEGAQIIRQGDLELKLKIGTGDEIEELASSFNQMALALNHNIRQLEDSEGKYRSLVTSMRDGIYQTDPDWTITFMNPAGAEIFGYERPEAAVGHNLRELFLEEMDFARITTELNRQSFVERTRIWMKRIPVQITSRRDNLGRGLSELCAELSANRVVNDSGEFVGTEGIFRDVTTSVRLEQQARERSERISAINQIANVINSSLESGRLHESLVVELRKLVNFDYASVVLAADPSDPSLGTVFEKRVLFPEWGLFMEGVGQELKGACASWVVRERKCLSIVDFKDSDSSMNPVSKDLLSAFSGEFPPTTRSCLCVPLYATGRIIGTLNLGSNRVSAYSVHDIEVIEEMGPHIAVAMRNARLLDNLQQSLNEVTQAREKLHEANEELKTLDEMKTNLLSNVSHELRTPLVAVMGYTDMIFNRKAGPINETQAEYLSIAIRNIEKLVTLIENLLDFSRLHRGTEKLVFDTFDLVDCARISIQNVQPVADARGIQLKLHVADHPGADLIPVEEKEAQVLVDGDKSKMVQVFNNLLSNAVKFNHNGGKVTIEIRHREDSVEVATIDTGIGIPPEALDKVFTRFYQYDSSSTRKYGGTGIGLSIAQDIIRLHGSRIIVTSDAGKGSTFRFSLPLRGGRSAVEADPMADLPILKATNVLVELVTQDRSLNLEIRDQLAPDGMDVISAPDAQHAISLARKHSPACIMVDTNLNEGGAAALEMLLGQPDVALLPLLLLTDDDALAAQYASRVAARVRRSFRKSSLLSGIHYALSQSAPTSDPLGRKILCVDDDNEVLLFVTRCLKGEGFEADAVGSGAEALERLHTREYGLVLLDLAMPGIDGWETCRRIRNDIGLAGLKVYLVTAKPIDRNTTRIQEIGADGFLLKPFKPEELAKLVHLVFPSGPTENA